MSVSRMLSQMLQKQTEVLHPMCNVIEMHRCLIAPPSDNAHLRICLIVRSCKGGLLLIIKQLKLSFYVRELMLLISLS